MAGGRWLSLVLKVVPLVSLCPARRPQPQEASSHHRQEAPPGASRPPPCPSAPWVPWSCLLSLLAAPTLTVLTRSLTRWSIGGVPGGHSSQKAGAWHPQVPSVQHVAGTQSLFSEHTNSFPPLPHPVGSGSGPWVPSPPFFPWFPRRRVCCFPCLLFFLFWGPGSVRGAVVG